MTTLIVSLHVRHSPQAVALAAGNLKAALSPAQQQRTQLLDLYLDQSLEEMYAQIVQQHADCIAFSLYLWNRMATLQLAKRLKQEKPALFLLVGGPEASADSRRLLETGSFDAILRGEGEESFALLVQCLENNQSIEGIAGLFTRGAGTLPPACSCEIEALKSPWLDNSLQPVRGGVLWEVARGCPFGCDFCYDAKGMAGVRPLPMERLEAELDVFCQNGAEQVWILDSTFNAPAKRGHALLQRLIAKAPHLHYHLEAKAEFIDARTIELLGQLSCSIQLGLQSTDPEVLAGLNRKIAPDKFWQGVELLAHSGLTFGLDLIYGLPGDSYQGFCASLDRALAYRPNQVDIFPLAILPGTKLFQQKETLKLTAEDLPPYLLQQSADFAKEDLRNCALLARATDIFYNLGRAVGFFAPCCAALNLNPLDLLQEFKGWLIEHLGGEQNLLGQQEVATHKILAWQKAFLQQRFAGRKTSHLWPLVEDIVNYHYTFAETLLAAETPPNTAPLPADQVLIRAPGVALLELNTDILGALESEAIDLPRWHSLIEAIPTTGLMIRRGNEVVTEILTAEFAEILRRAQQTGRTEELGKDLPLEEATEILNFALQEGLLVAAT